jgi:GT2 family glycosyltransferase
MKISQFSDYNIYSIIVTFNAKYWIRNCLKSLIESSIQNHKVLVVDNASKDDTLSIIKKEFPTVLIIENSINFGFAVANNQGLKFALQDNADFLFLLNQDAYAFYDTIENLVYKLIENPDYGLLSPIHLSSDGKSFDKLFYKYLISSDILWKNKDNCSKNFEIRDIDFVNAAAWMIPSKTISKIGLFDPLFFMYGEDVNYINRILYKGLKVGVLSKTFIIHDRESRPSVEYNENKLVNLRKSVVLHKLLNPFNVISLELIKVSLYISKYILIHLFKGNLFYSRLYFFLLINIYLNIPIFINHKKLYTRGYFNL